MPKYFEDWKHPTEDEIAKLMADREECDSLSYDEIKRRLETAGGGANIHDVNKAKFWIDYYQKRDDLRFKYNKNYDRLRELCFMAFCAVKYDDWRELKEWMRGLY